MDRYLDFCCDTFEDLSEELYSQCFLQKGKLSQTAWIPQKFAKLDKVLRLKNSDGTWDDGWVVRIIHVTAPEWKLGGTHYVTRRVRAAKKEKGRQW